MKKSFAHLLTLCLLLLPLTGCQKMPNTRAEYYDLFDTFCTFQAYGLDADHFQTVSTNLHALLLDFHNEVDIYESHEGITNLYDLNRAAGSGKMLTVSPRLFDFLIFCQEALELSSGRVNVMIGAVSSLWKQALSDQILPEPAELKSAARHIAADSLVLDTATQSVAISDAQASLDVGALAKGYAARLAKEYLAEEGINDYLLSLGGNIYASGSPLGSGRDYFTIGIQDPQAPEGVYSNTLSIQNEAAVTSGDYQRYTEIDGQRYHHIIDPDTLRPCTLHRAVTIVHPDPAMADLLSTAAFLLPSEEGISLVEALGGKAYYYQP